MAKRGRALGEDKPRKSGKQPEILAILAKDGSIDSNKPAEISLVLDYLERFGHLVNTWRDWRSITLGDIADAIKSFQSFFGLKIDGWAGPKTLRAMLQTPRCGCPDIVRERHAEYSRIQKLVEKNLAKWNKTELTYGIHAFVGGLPEETQREVIAQAWKHWTDVCGIRVREITKGVPDIFIETGQGKKSQFDGAGGTLAWAYLPNGSDQQLTMRFDLAETWTVDPKHRGVLMLNVACHEFGHLLGLDHSKVETALMAPFYSPAVDRPQANDDIPRVVARYGEPSASPAPTPAPGAPATPKTISAQIKVDGVTYAGQLTRAA